MTSFLKTIGTFVAGAVLALTGGAMLGGEVELTAKKFTQGIFAGTANQFSIEADGDLSTSGAITTTGQIRSDKSTFCMDFYATSTATRVKMTASSTATIEGTDGVMVTSYGSCS